MRAAILAVVVTLSLVANVSAADWTGIYRVEGKNPEGKPYTGAVEVAKVPETGLYSLRWQMDEDITGEAVMFALAFEHEKLLVATGVNIVMLGSFKRKGEGKWIMPEVFTPLPEKWTPTKAKTLQEALKPKPRPAGHPPVATPSTLSVTYRP